MKVEFRLGYSKIQCARCGDPSRIYGVPCPTCGAPPGPSEVNSLVVSRKKLASACLKILETRAARVPMDGFYKAYRREFSEVESVFSGTLKALEAAAQSPPAQQSIHSLKSQLKKLAETRDRLDSYEERRPHIAQLSMLRRTMHHTEQMTRAYLQAFAAPTPWEAKALGSTAQTHIDAAAAVMADATLHNRAVELMASATELNQTFPSVLSALEVLHPGQTLTELESKGQSRYLQVSGGSATAGTGLSYLIFQLLADAHLSPERFSRVIRGTTTLLAARHQVLADHLAKDNVVRDLHAAKQRALEGHAQANLMLSMDLDDEAVFRQMLKLYWVMFEEVGIPIMATMLKISGVDRSYDSLMTDDAGELARRIASNKSLNPLFYGLNKNFRNAASHGHTFRLERDLAVFELRTFTEKIPVEVVIDACFSLMESVYGIQLALDTEISKLGVEGHQLKHAGPFQPDDLDIAAVIIRGMGIDIKESEFRQATWVLKAEGEIRSLTGLAKTMSKIAPGHIESLDIGDTKAGIDRRLCMPVKAISCFRAKDGEELIKDLVALMLDWRENDGSFLVGPRLRCAIGSIGVLALQRDDVYAIPLLRRLRTKADGSNDLEASEAINRVIRAIRIKSEPRGSLIASIQPWIDGDLLALP
ncbi:hypothetical protein [Arthrobacter sp. YD2]|uniref:hypothetical protein n=1 Tax=Arthrobacter sp. YD2 TaxID=3058046 RepID=UPI0025B290AD|nr:hypothetical protein [Arthrobacter sp. YD2]MDN3905782.1 hypothetical protein [Arthrobacter sp. YD2]